MVDAYTIGMWVMGGILVLGLLYFVMTGSGEDTGDAAMMMALPTKNWQVVPSEPGLDNGGLTTHFHDGFWRNEVIEDANACFPDPALY